MGAIGPYSGLLGRLGSPNDPNGSYNESHRGYHWGQKQLIMRTSSYLDFLGMFVTGSYYEALYRNHREPTNMMAVVVDGIALRGAKIDSIQHGTWLAVHVKKLPCEGPCSLGIE